MTSSTSNSDLEDAFQILKHFTDFGQDGHNYASFPVRCFVRYRFDSDAKWKTFWERKRNDDELDQERDDSDWKDDKELKRPLHAETYVIRRIQKAVDDHDSESDKGDEFEVKKHFFTCYPHVVHLHYPCRKVTTLQFDQQQNREVVVRCFYPHNILHDKNKTFTCYNPQSVVIGEVKDKDKDKNTPKIVICDSMKTTGNPQWSYDVTAINAKSVVYLNYKLEKLEVEMYLNTSPCQACFNELVNFVDQNENVFIHVKYASFYYLGDQNDYDRVNSAPGRRLKITPFTDSDWRILNRGIKELMDTKVKGLKSDVDQKNQRVDELEKILKRLKEVLNGDVKELEHGTENSQLDDKDDGDDNEL